MKLNNKFYKKEIRIILFIWITLYSRENNSRTSIPLVRFYHYDVMSFSLDASVYLKPNISQLYDILALFHLGKAL